MISLRVLKLTAEVYLNSSSIFTHMNNVFHWQIFSRNDLLHLNRQNSRKFKFVQNTACMSYVIILAFFYFSRSQDCKLFAAFNQINQILDTEIFKLISVLRKQRESIEIHQKGSQCNAKPFEHLILGRTDAQRQQFLQFFNFKIFFVCVKN